MPTVKIPGFISWYVWSSANTQVTSTALLLLIHLPSSVCDDVAAPVIDDEARTCSLAAGELEREVGVSGEVELDAGLGVCFVDELEVVRRVRATEDAAQLEVRLSANQSLCYTCARHKRARS